MEPSSKPGRDFVEALDELPLFPLPDLVLLPGGLLPLHIFEPRYRKLVRDALDGPRSIGIVCIPDPSSTEPDGRPRLARVGCAGTILDHAELPSGRFNILVRGIERVTLEELPFVSPYRRARAVVVPSTDEDVPHATMTAFVAASTAFLTLVRERDQSFDLRFPKNAAPGALADHCAQRLLMNARDRQAALETPSVIERVIFVTEALAMQQAALSKGGGVLN